MPVLWLQSVQFEEVVARSFPGRRTVRSYLAKRFQLEDGPGYQHHLTKGLTPGDRPLIGTCSAEEREKVEGGVEQEGKTIEATFHEPVTSNRLHFIKVTRDQHTDVKTMADGANGQKGTPPFFLRYSAKSCQLVLSKNALRTRGHRSKKSENEGCGSESLKLTSETAEASNILLQYERKCRSIHMAETLIQYVQLCALEILQQASTFPNCLNSD